MVAAPEVQEAVVAAKAAVLDGIVDAEELAAAEEEEPADEELGDLEVVDVEEAPDGDDAEYDGAATIELFADSQATEQATEAGDIGPECVGSEAENDGADVADAAAEAESAGSS